MLITDTNQTNGYVWLARPTVNSRYKHTVGTGGGMLITNVCIYQEKITFMTK